MKFSFQALQKIVKLKVTPEELAVQLTNSGSEVEEIQGDIIDVSISPNRADCLGLIGIAREAAVLNNQIFVAPVISPIKPVIQDKLNLQVKNTQACPRYLSRIIRNVNNTKQSPQWLQDYLTSAGSKVISPVVDITNYVLLEWGQPLHAFDLAKIADNTIIVRDSVASEKIDLLDETSKNLQPGTLIIADNKQPLAIAGIMGGMSSAITPDTTSIVLECAYFEPVNIRLSARKHNIQTDSSYRYERGIDCNMQAQAIERATQLILEIVGGEPGPVVEVVDQKNLPTQQLINLRYARVKKILGIDVTVDNIHSILQNLGLQIANKTSEILTVTVPSFRTDLTTEIDLIEEIVRIYGFENIPAELPVGTLAFGAQPEARQPEGKILDCLINRGYSEAITYSFIDSELAKKFNPEFDPTWSLTNPISADMSLMRPSLLPGLISALMRNTNRQQSRVRLFEIGLRFIVENKKLEQIKTIAGVVCGNYLPENWANQKQPVDFYAVKTDVIELFKLGHNANNLEFKPTTDQAFHPGQAVSVFLNNIPVGKFGALHPALQKDLGLDQKAYMFELDYETIANGSVVSFTGFSKYPAVRRDLAILIDQKVTADNIKQVITQHVGKLLTDIIIFDIYQGKGIPEGKKSVGLGLTFQDPERTLQDAEINEIFANLLIILEQKLQASLR